MIVDKPGVTVTVTAEAGWDLVVIGGDLDMYTYPHAHAKILDSGLCTQNELVVDLAGVEFMDSTGMTLLVQLRRATQRRDARLDVVCPPGGPRKGLMITKLDQVINVVNRLDELH